MNNLGKSAGPVSNLDIFSRAGIGFDSIFKMLQDASTLANATTYPPYNIIAHDAETVEIHLAVAGFDQSELTIQLQDHILTVNGSKADAANPAYLYRGIANRAFERRFVLHDDVVVEGASLNNGILQIFLKKIVPEEKKPRTIEIVNKS